VQDLAVQVQQLGQRDAAVRMIVRAVMPTSVMRASAVRASVVPASVMRASVMRASAVRASAVAVAVVMFHGGQPTSCMRYWHSILRMTQEPDLDRLIRDRIKGLRLARGWSLDVLAARCFLSPSTLSRIETGHRRIALDQLVPIARALGTTLDQLVESADDDDVVIRPQRDEVRGITIWMLARERGPHGMTVAKMRMTEPPSAPGLGVHPGRDWFTVLSGTAQLQLGERTILVGAGEAAEFSTMTPHAMGAHGGPTEILAILTHDGERAHIHHLPDPANPVDPADTVDPVDTVDPLTPLTPLTPPRLPGFPRRPTAELRIRSGGRRALTRRAISPDPLAN
jgi:transcriptional regulator with XRE-family HTH domain